MIVNLEDINDNLAEFESLNLNLTLPEHSHNGLEVIRVNATDKDKVSSVNKHFVSIHIMLVLIIIIKQTWLQTKLFFKTELGDKRQVFLHLGGSFWSFRDRFENGNHSSQEQRSLWSGKVWSFAGSNIKLISVSFYSYFMTKILLRLRILNITYIARVQNSRVNLYTKLLPKLQSEILSV